MTITKDFVAKLLVAFVAAAMIVTAFAPAAQAQTTEDLQQMINDLLAQVAALQEQTSATAGSPDLCPYTWTRDLTNGSEGADVMKLQQFLNSYPDLRLGATGAGSAGMETMYYGPATAAAVSKMQVMFRAEVLTPNGLVNPTGYFGPSSRAKANGLCVAPVVTPTPGDEDGTDEEDEDEEGDMTLSGEGSLVTFEIDDEETEVSEGDEDVPVMRLTLEAEDGDVEVARLGFYLTADNGTTNQEDEPWDVFTEVSLWVDGDKIASFEADDEGEYIDDDAGTEEFRFSNLGLILDEDEEVEVLVAVSVMNSVDGSDVSNAAKWNIEPSEVRYFDADGVATTEDELDEMDRGQTDGNEETFDIEEEGVDDGADVESSSSNPDAATLLVDEDTDDSDELTVHLFDIEVDNDSGDLEVGDAYVDVTMSNPAANADVGGQDDVLDEIFMTIDGVTVEGEATTLGTDNEDDVIASSSNTVVRYLFEFDQDVVLEGDEDYEVEISMSFRGQDNGADYENGLTVETSVTGSQWEVEGSENDNELSGSDDSETHTLATVIPVITDTDFTVSPNETDTAGTISYEFTMEADGENDITFSFGDVDAVNGATDDVRFTITGGVAVSNAVITQVTGDAVATGSTGWTLADGDDATFSLDVTLASTSPSGAYRLNIDTIEGLEVDETSGTLNLFN